MYTIIEKLLKESVGGELVNCIKRILLHFLIFLAVVALGVGGYFLVLHLALEDWNDKINTSYTFPQEEYWEAWRYAIDKKPHYLGSDTLINNEQTVWVYELKGLDTEEFLYLLRKETAHVSGALPQMAAQNLC